MRKLFWLAVMLILFSCGQSDEEREAVGVQSMLFLGEGENQKLVVGLGGSEGGNAWALNDGNQYEISSFMRVMLSWLLDISEWKERPKNLTGSRWKKFMMKSSKLFNTTRFLMTALH
jgi:hypothetical protein